MRATPWLMSASLLLAACAVDEFDASAHTSCPCIAGWRCDERTSTCVMLATGGHVDAGAEPDGGGSTEEDGGATQTGDGGGGGGMDGGTTLDSGPTGTDGGTVFDSGPLLSNCDGPFGSRLFCDGFESGDTSRWDGIVTGGAGAVTVVRSPIVHGRPRAARTRDARDISGRRVEGSLPDLRRFGPVASVVLLLPERGRLQHRGQLDGGVRLRVRHRRGDPVGIHEFPHAQLVEQLRAGRLGDR